MSHKDSGKIPRGAIYMMIRKIVQDPLSFTTEEGRLMDRALRTCAPSIHPIWVRWDYLSEKYKWDTSEEMSYHPNLGLFYPGRNHSKLRAAALAWMVGYAQHAPEAFTNAQRNFLNKWSA